MDRRDFLAALGAWLAAGGAGGQLVLPGPALAGTATPFRDDTVLELARQLAAAPFVKPQAHLEPPLDKLTYDQYRDVRFRPEQALWRGEGLKSELQFFPMGWLFDAPVDISVVESGAARPIEPDVSLFKFGPLVEAPADGMRFGFSGFRVHSPINRPDYYDEYAVFQGASYFRCVARGQAYGLSARGLAIDTAQPTGEEFPLFRSFWIEKPTFETDQLVVHALLDSPSATGAYRFMLMPGETTRIDVEARLFPRKDLAYAGLAPLTSMFLFAENDRMRVDDFRSAVHDSDGLAVLNGAGERLWRPLVNPRSLQASSFLDEHPRGFGLIQRARKFADFQDMEASYHRRPSLWIEPLGPWGKGSVSLIEIPTEEEIHDNIVAFWRPAEPLKAGVMHRFAYRLHWCAEVPDGEWTGATVLRTRAGATARKPGMETFAVDFVGAPVADPQSLPEALVWASAGKLSKPIVQANPDTGGARVSFEFAPEADLAELRLELRRKDKIVSEVWMYRWIRS